MEKEQKTTMLTWKTALWFVGTMVCIALWNYLPFPIMDSPEEQATALRSYHAWRSGTALWTLFCLLMAVRSHFLPAKKAAEK